MVVNVTGQMCGNGRLSMITRRNQIHFSSGKQNIKFEIRSCRCKSQFFLPHQDERRCDTRKSKSLLDQNNRSGKLLCSLLQNIAVLITLICMHLLWLFRRKIFMENYFPPDTTKTVKTDSLKTDSLKTPAVKTDSVSQPPVQVKTDSVKSK